MGTNAIMLVRTLKTTGDDNLLTAIYCGCDPGTALLAVKVDVFPNDDGIIHDDPQSNDEGKHGNHVDTDTRNG